jgi:hypothetical protein
LAQKVVLDLVAKVQGKWHVISMDNFITSVGLIEELASMQIYATSTLRTNWIGLSSALKKHGHSRMYRKEHLSGGCTR